MISVIVPVYNIKDYVSECIDSLINQTNDNYEVILVDDGSNDGSGEICDSYANQYNGVQVIHKKNGGLVSARKAGMLRAKGDYIINVDGDDYVSIDLIATIDKEINSHYPDVIAYGFEKFEDCELKTIIATIAYDEDKLFIKNEIQELRSRYLYDPKKKGLNDGYIPHCIWGKAVKRDLYIECQNLIPDKISKGEDTVMTILLLDRARSVKLCKYIGYKYRARLNSMINTINPDDFIKLESIMQWIDDNVSQYVLDYKLQINTYFIKRIATLLRNAIKGQTNTFEFLKYARASEKMIDSLGDILVLRTANITMKERVILHLIKNKLWRIMFLTLR